MSLKTLPLLFINLGGEMMYILDQRLRAQNIPPEKARKVLHDITGTMFNKRFMEELFKPQELYSKKAMRTVFDRLAHASIMRLNSASMDKLYDLMTMAFKYQVSLCLKPSEILLITLNHMDTMRSFVEGSPNIRAQVDFVFKLLIEHFAHLSPGEFMLVRQTLLNFFQDMHIRVSIFLKDKVQNSNGRFVLPTSGPVPYGSELPGVIRVFDDRGQQIKEKEFHPGGRWTLQKREGSVELKGDRVTKLGTNMYNVANPLGAMIANSSKSSTIDGDMSSPNPLAKAQLDLLSKLIGSEERCKSARTEIRLNLFNSEEEADDYIASKPVVEEAGSRVISIDASKKKQSAELSRIMGELRVDGASSGNYDEDDLLDLMDSAN